MSWIASPRMAPEPAQQRPASAAAAAAPAVAAACGAAAADVAAAAAAADAVATVWIAAGSPQIAAAQVSCHQPVEGSGC